jgi:hypothetical protein
MYERKMKMPKGSRTRGNVAQPRKTLKKAVARMQKAHKEFTRSADTVTKLATPGKERRGKARPFDGRVIHPTSREQK